MTSYNETSLSSLQDLIDGRILTPEHPDYDAARQVWNLSIEHHAALILIPETADDVAAGVRFARDAGLSVAVQSSGHGQKYESNNSILIITSQMTAVELDLQARTARVGAGAKWQHVIDAASPHGLAPLLGSAPHVGVVGYSLSGGVGWLSRQYGFAADSIREIELVTANGDLIHASATENSGLFWGLRGAAGNFGVVTSITFELYPVATIYGGTLTYPGDTAAEALRFFRDWTQAAPDTLTGWFRIMKFPNLPQMPDAIRGKILVMVEVVYLGEKAEGQRLIQPWLDWCAPVSSEFHELPFADIGKVTNDPTRPTAGVFSNALLKELSDNAIDAIVRQATDPQVPFVINELRHMGGAVSRIDPASTAIGHRDAQYYLQFGAPRIQGGPIPAEERAALEVAAQAYKQAFPSEIISGIYYSFAGSKEARENIHDLFSPETLARLVELKRQYDPTNMFRYGVQLTAEQ